MKIKVRYGPDVTYDEDEFENNIDNVTLRHHVDSNGNLRIVEITVFPDEPSEYVNIAEYRSGYWNKVIVLD